MDYRVEAIQVTRRAEAEIQALIEQAVRGGLYQDIADLAAIAQGLSTLRAQLGDVGDRTRASSVPPSELAAARGVSHGKRSAKRQRKATPTTSDGSSTAQESEYPRFFRDQGKLVKVGWSERDGSTYEHRSPVQVIRAVAQKIESLTNNSDTFRMEKVLPMRVAGNEVPSYQAYLALAWLRRLDLVDRSGKNGYLVRSSGNLLKLIDGFWESLPMIASQRKEIG